MRYTLFPRHLIMLMFIPVLSHFSATAQGDLSKEVSVVRPYSPTIADALKTRFIPRLDDTLQVETQFDYSILPVKVNPASRLRELDANLYRPSPREDLKYSFLRLGFGNYWTPMAQLGIHTLRNEKTSLGVDMSHLSSQGRIKMADDRKIYAGYADNRVKIYGEKFINKSTLSASAYFTEDHHYLYGYSTDSIKIGADSLIAVTPLNYRLTQKDSVKLHRFIILGTRVGLGSNQTSSNGWQYRIDGGYDFLLDHQEAMEHQGQLKFKLSKDFRTISVGGDLGGDYVYRTHQPDSLNYVLASLNPWIRFNWKFVSLMGGPRVFMDRNAARFLFYPNVRLEFNITNVLVPYVGLDGYYENHTLRSISRENPYIIDNIDFRPTNHRFIAFGGLRGRFTPKVAFNLAVSWEDAQDLLFFVPATVPPQRNEFVVVSDTGRILQMGGEISLRQSDNLTFILKGNYYQYTLYSLPAPWHKPGWDLNFTTRYAWKKKLTVKAELFLFGKYSVPEPDPLKGQVRELDGLVDINLGAEYRFNKWLSAFAQVNNMISDKYFIWQNYPMQGINFLGGLSLTF